MIVINLSNQTLCHGDWRVKCSTAKVGAGQRGGSGGTPLGLHRIDQAIGQGAHAHQSFVGRLPKTLWTPQADPTQDWILSRILWLDGLEAGYNRGGTVDSKSRYIYIHAAPPTEPMGVPRSHGCVRVAPHDMVTLFERVAVGELVWIKEYE